MSIKRADTHLAQIKRPTPTEFGQIVRSWSPGSTHSDEALADWHRRVALSLLPRLGFREGSAQSVGYLRVAGL